MSRRAAEMSVMLASIRHGIMLWGADRRLIASKPGRRRAAGASARRAGPGQVAGRNRSTRCCGAASWARFDRGRAIDRRHWRCATGRRPISGVHHARGAGAGDSLRADPGGGFVSTFTDITEARARGGRAASRQAGRGDRQPGEVALPGHHEPRTAHATERGDRLLRGAAARGGPTRAAAGRRVCPADQRVRAPPARSDQHHPRCRPDRGGALRHGLGPGRDRTPGADCVRQADAVAQAAEIALATDLRPDLPRLRADERRLAQVLRHLLSNAVKFTDAGGVVTVGAENGAGWGAADLRARYRHRHRGVRHRARVRAVHPARQDAGAAVRGGGLGLYMSRALAEGHGGRLRLTSRAGEGTTAEIRLPATQLVEDAGK